MDEDLPPHGAPFHFQLSPRVPELARNWSLSQINSEFPAPLHPGGPDLGPEVHSAHGGPTGSHLSTPSGRAVVTYHTHQTNGETGPAGHNSHGARRRHSQPRGTLLTSGTLHSEPRAPASEAPGPGGAAPPQPAAPRLRAAAPAARAAPERDRVPLRPGRNLPARGLCAEGWGCGHQPGRPSHHAGQHRPAAL